MNLMIFILSLSFTLSPNSCEQQKEKCDNGIFQEEGGIVAFEAESISLPSGWSHENSADGFSGNGYITWTDSTTLTPGEGLLSYKFKINKPGYYTLKIRNYHSCEDFTECNDVFVKMNDGDWRKNFNHTVNEWDWNSQQDINHVFSDSKYFLDKGEHVVYLSGRSQNFSIDKMALFHESTPENAYKKVSQSSCIVN